MCDDNGKKEPGAAVLLEPRPVITGPERALVREHPEPRELTDAEMPLMLGKQPLKPHLHLQGVHLDAAVAERTVKTGVGILKRVVVNSAPAGINGVLTLRDGQQGGGAVLAVIVPVAGSPVSLRYDMPFTKGLTLALVGATSGDWSVIFE